MSVPYKSTPHGLIAQESNDFWLVTFARFFTDSTTMSLDKFLNIILIFKRLWNVYCTYRKVSSSNTSYLEAHAGFFRLNMKGVLMLM